MTKTENKNKAIIDHQKKFILSQIEIHGQFENKWPCDWIVMSAIGRLMKEGKIKLGVMSYHENRLYISA